jgi:hypothetical protein
MSDTLLDLVRQYGVVRYAERADSDQSKALFDRIAELLPQQPVQARSHRALLLWQHKCGATVAKEDPTETVCWSCVEPGPWRPLLVGGTRTPEADDVVPTEHFEEPVRIIDPQSDLMAQVMAELGVGRPEDVLDALDKRFNALVKARKDRDQMWQNAEAWRRQCDRASAEAADYAERLKAVDRSWTETARQRDEYRAEVERLKAEIWERKQFDARAPQQDGPLRLTLPKVPEGAAWLKGGMSGHRWSPTEFGRWVDEETGQVRGLLPLLEREGSVTVEMAPREPRTAAEIWAGLSDRDRLVRAPLMELAEALNREAGLPEVFDDEPGGERP